MGRYSTRAGGCSFHLPSLLYNSAGAPASGNDNSAPTQIKLTFSLDKNSVIFGRRGPTMQGSLKGLSDLESRVNSVFINLDPV